MPVYNIAVNVEQTVHRELKMVIDSPDEESAVVQAEEALQDYPKAIMTSRVHRMVSLRDEFSPPTEVKFVSIREDRRFAH